MYPRRKWLKYLKVEKQITFGGGITKENKLLKKVFVGIVVI